MDFEELRDANQRRHQEWAGGNAVSLSFRGLELGGEAGELLNELKKLERTRLGLAGGSSDLGPVAEELADVIICADLIAMDLGVDLSQAVREKFDATSAKFGLNTRFEAASNS